MSRSKNSSKGSFTREAKNHIVGHYAGYAFEGVNSIDGKKYFKRYVGKVNRRILNVKAKEVDD